MYYVNNLYYFKGILALGPLINHLVQLTDWRVVYRMLSVLILVVCVPAGLLVSPQPPFSCCDNDQANKRLSKYQKKPVPSTGTSDDKTNHDVVSHENKKDLDKGRLIRLLCSVDCWLLVIGTTLLAIASTFLIINLVSVLLIMVN